MSKSNVNPNHYKVAGRERQGEDIEQVRHKQRYAESVVPGRSTRGARRERPALIPGPPPRGAAPLRTAKKAASTGAKKKSSAKKSSARTASSATKASTNAQASDKRGKRSTAQKRASSRHDFGPIPATSPVAGAFGKEPSPRRKPRKG